MSAPETEINAAARNAVRNALSITSANADAVVVVGAGEATDSAQYCDKLLDESEVLRQKLKEKYKNESWITSDAYNERKADKLSPHEIFVETNEQNKADHLRRCIELSLEIQEEYEKLDAATKDLEKLNNMEGETYTTTEYGPPSGGLFDISPQAYAVKHNIAEERAATMQQITSSLNVINELENTQNAIGPNTPIDKWIKKAWEYDDRWFLTDVTIGAFPVGNAMDSGRAAYVYGQAGRPGMAALMTAFAAVDTASSAATLAGGAGIVSGGVTGGVKGVVKASVKAALKRSAKELRSLFKALSKAGELIKSRRVFIEAAEKALTCAKACATGR